MKRFYMVPISLMAAGLLTLAGCGGSSSSSPDAPPVLADVDFSETVLPHLDENASLFSAGVAISSAGTAVGYGDDGTGATKGVKWDILDPETATALAPLIGNAYSAAYGVNGAGITVGESGSVVGEESDANTVAVFWSADNLAFQLPAPTGNAGPYAAYSINGSGLIVGESTVDENGTTHAILWGSAAIDAEATSLHQDGWDFSAAYYIHDDGMIVGEAKPAGDVVQGVVWTPAGAGFTATLLSPAENDTSSVAFGIDTLGRIIGESEGSGSVRGTVWTINVQGDTITDTLTLPANTSLQAINDNSRMVGYTAALSSNDRASVWNAGDPNDSKNIADAFSQAYGINNSLEIVGISGTRAYIAAPQ